MNLQQTFIGMLGTVSTVSSFNRNAKAAEAQKNQAAYEYEANELKSAYDEQTAIDEKEFSKNEDIIKSEAEVHSNWLEGLNAVYHNKAIKDKKFDSDSYNKDVNKRVKDLETKYGKEIADQIVLEASYKNNSIIDKGIRTYTQEQAGMSSKSPTQLRVEAFAQKQLDMQNKHYNDLNTLKKRYNIGGTK